jgi:signal transduction histidine kinase
LRKLTTFTDESMVVPHVVITGTPIPLPRFKTHHLLRIAQEATTNAVRHAAPTRINLELDYTEEAIVLSIVDDGTGFSPDEALNKTGHFGLRGIRGRARKLGGEFTIESAPGAGTAIRIRVPLTPEDLHQRHAETVHHI